MQLNTVNQRAAASDCLARKNVQECLLPLLSQAEAALQKSGKQKRKGKLTSVLNAGVIYSQQSPELKGPPALTQCNTPLFLHLAAALRTNN